MSTSWTDTVMHAQFNAQGLATMGVDPQWDRAVHNLVSADVLARAHEHFGPLELKRNEGQLQAMEAEHRLGKNWREHPEGKPFWETLCDEGTVNDQQMTELYYNALWEAQRQLALTPAPTLAAALFKAAVIEMNDVWNDSQIDADCIELIEADLARLSQREGVAA